MATIIRKEFVELLEFVITEFEKKMSKRMIEFPTKDNFFELLSKDIKKETSVEIKSSTLYKSYHLDLTYSKEVEANVSEKYANALSQYYQGTNYDEIYTIIDSRKINYESIKENPEMPEYPVDNPGFPATPSIPVFFDVEKWNEKEKKQLNKYVEIGINDVNLTVKDESKHKWVPNLKSRAAWEIFLFAKGHLKKMYDENKQGVIFRASLLSAGNFALAVFVRLIIQGINFQLRVILDKEILESTSDELKEKRKALQQVLEVEKSYPRNLKTYLHYIDERKLTSKDIFKLTECDESNSFDLTFGGGIENFKEIKSDYFDWLSYEILSQSPNHIFMPFGGGELMECLLEVLVFEINRPLHKKSKRYFGDDEILKLCNFYGLTSINKNSSLDKLYVKNEFHPKTNFEFNLKRYYDLDYQGEIDIQTEEDFENLHDLEKYLSDAEIIFKHFGIKSEPSGRAGMALFLKEFRKHPKEFIDKKVLVVNTGLGNWDEILNSPKFKKLAGDI